MRRDKTVARIFLIFSIVNVALAAPAVIRDGHVDLLAEDLTATPEKRADDDVAPGPSGSSTPPRTPAPPSPPKHVTWKDGWVRASESDQSATLSGPVSDSSHLTEPTSFGSDQSQYLTTLATGSTSSHYDSAPMSGAPHLHNDPLPGSGAPQLHESGPDGELHWFWDTWQPSKEIKQTDLLSHSSSSGSGGAGEPVTAAPEAKKFFSDELKQKMKDYAVLGTVVGISTGLINGAQKEIMGTISPGAETIGRDLASRDAVRRGAGIHLHLIDHFQPRKDPVSRGLANLRDGDLRWLSVLTRRALENLD